jgi:NitT/TauT family transport system ATP-binding protein
VSNLSFESVSKHYGKLEALRDINFDIASGQFISVVGPSGCGKTTLLRIVAGLESLDLGRVLIDGQKIDGPGIDRGIVFQSDSLLPWRTIYSNVTLGLRLNNLLDAAGEQRSRALLELVGLGRFADFWPAQLSGGMRQRANLARALAINPNVLLMDEPFSALDAQTREVMQTELLRIWEVGRKTVMFITHQIDEAIFLADRVLVLGRRPGRVKEIIEVPFARPRTLELKRRPEFTALVDRVWSMIESDVRDSVLEESESLLRQ